MTSIGFAETQSAAQKAIAVLAAFASFATLAVQLGHLPALYGAYNRRETAVALLNARAGVPTWGPELLARGRPSSHCSTTSPRCSPIRPA